MAYGPVEMVVIKFPGNQFTGEIVPALDELVQSGTIRIIDLLFVLKDPEGNVAVLDANGMGDAVVAVFAPIAQPEDELVSQSDGERIGELLEPNSSAAMLLFENAWAARFAQAVRNAKGELILNERIPRAVIEEVLASASE